MPTKLLLLFSFSPLETMTDTETDTETTGVSPNSPPLQPHGYSNSHPTNTLQVPGSEEEEDEERVIEETADMKEGQTIKQGYLLKRTHKIGVSPPFPYIFHWNIGRLC